MKNLKYVLVVFLCTAAINLSNAQGIEFYKGDFAGAVAKAKQENKLVFIDFYTTWCGPCKAMDANIFPDAKVGEFFNEKFVSIKIDAEKGEGIQLAKKYKVKGYPTLLYLNTDESEKDRLVGATPNPEFLINFTKQALGEGQKFTEFFKDYEEKGNRDLDYIHEILVKGPVYAQSIKDQEEQRKWFNKFFEISKWYFVAKQPKELLNADDFKLIAQYLDGPNNRHPVVEFVYNNYDEYKKLVPVKDLTMFIMRTNNQSIHDASGKGDTSFREYVEAINGRLKQAHIDAKTESPEDKGDSYTIMKYVSEGSYAKSQNDYDTYLDWSQKYKDYSASIEPLQSFHYSSTIGNLLYHINYNNGKSLNEAQIKRCHKIITAGLKAFPGDRQLIEQQGDLFAMQGKKTKAIANYNKVINLVKGQRGEDYFKKAMTEKIKKLQ